MLKINLQTNRWIMIVAIVRLALILYTNITAVILPMRPASHLHIWIRFGSELLQVVLLYYMISVLFLLKEKQFIKIALILYAGLYTLRILFFSLINQAVHASGTFYIVSTGLLGLFTIFIDIFLLVACISIANKTVSKSYILFSGTITFIALATVGVNFLAPFLYRFKSDPISNVHLVYNMVNIVSLAAVLMPAAAILLTKNTNKLLKTEEPQPFLYRP